MSRYIIHNQDGTNGIIETNDIWKFLGDTLAVIYHNHVYICKEW